MFLISIIKIIAVFSRKLRDDYISAFSAQAAFFIFISFFPFAMLLLSLLKYLPLSQTELTDIIRSIMPHGMNSFILTVINELYDKAASSTILSVTIIATLWASSKGFLSIIRGMNGVYNHRETRNYFTIRLKASLYTLAFAFLIIILLLFFVFGNQLYLWVIDMIPSLTEFALLIISVRTIVGLCVLILFFLLLYVVIPNRKTSIMKELPGSVLCAAGWMIFSYLYSFYIDNMSNLSYTYGSLTAIVLFMLWLYFCMYMLFIGAEVNSVLANPQVREPLKKLLSRK